MSLAILSKIAERKSSYISFEDLKPGTYHIKKASVMKKSKYDKEKRVMLYIKNGYVILPARFNDILKKKKVMTDLNAGGLALVFKGKDKKRQNRVLVSFKKFGKAVVDDSSSDDDDNSKESNKVSDDESQNKSSDKSATDDDSSGSSEDFSGTDENNIIADDAAKPRLAREEIAATPTTSAKADRKSARKITKPKKFE